MAVHVAEDAAKVAPDAKAPVAANAVAVVDKVANAAVSKSPHHPHGSPRPVLVA